MDMGWHSSILQAAANKFAKFILDWSVFQIIYKKYSQFTSKPLQFQDNFHFYLSIP